MTKIMTSSPLPLNEKRELFSAIVVPLLVTLCASALWFRTLLLILPGARALYLHVVLLRPVSLFSFSKHPNCSCSYSSFYVHAINSQAAKCCTMMILVLERLVYTMFSRHFYKGEQL